MINFEARNVIEALRSGVSSRAAGHYLSSARAELLAQISDKLHEQDGGMIISGSYGEGKTHLLNTVLDMAHKRNMVVSFISLSKETPLDKLHLIYQKVVANTYLPERMQPGFTHLFENMTPNSALATEMLLLAGKHLETDKLYFLLKSYLNTSDADEKFALLADLEGDFIGNNDVKTIYKRLFNERVTYSVNFSKTKHAKDYFVFTSNLFKKLGYAGWVILFDESELIGRLGKKARLGAYANLETFMAGEIPATMSIFAFNTSFLEDIDAKKEVESISALPEEQRQTIEKAINQIRTAVRLNPLTNDELLTVLGKIKEFHAAAYQWQPNVDVNQFLASVESRGYLLRTKIRLAIEILDQIYQYGHAGKVSIGTLSEMQYEDDIPLPEELA